MGPGHPIHELESSSPSYGYRDLVQVRLVRAQHLSSIKGTKAV